MNTLTGRKRTYDVGFRSGMLEIVRLLDSKKAEFRCDCGIEFVAQTSIFSESRLQEDCGCGGLNIRSGDTQGRWTVLDRVGLKSVVARRRINIECDCGHSANISMADWADNKTPTHVCPWDHELIGQRFGRLTVKEPLRERLRGNIQFLCDCECGERTSAIGADLRRGNNRSCGCLQRETASLRGRLGFPISTEVSYNTVHSLLTRAKGKASQFPCSGEDCTNEAHHWAYNHQDPDEVVDRTTALGYVYSLNMDFYNPLCRKCHIQLDNHREETNPVAIPEPVDTNYSLNRISAYPKRINKPRKGNRGTNGLHVRWHVNRGLTNPDCPHCVRSMSELTRTN